jgi:ribonuclease HII
MTTVLGIDEAGRGPVIGPMVICGYLIDEEKLGDLKKAGARDSKLLTDAKRRELECRLKCMAKDFVLITITAEELDRLMEEKNLNKIEISKMQELVNLLNPDKVIIDSPETNTAKFCEKVRAHVKNKGIEIICENYADRKYPVVGAASILAKVARDNAINEIKKEVGFDFRTGYSHDEVTIKFLKDWYARHKSFPPWVRKKWMTTKSIIKDHREKKEQKKVKDFFKD